jgi:glycosyltransferase involved in cell wall biosynthesis
MCGITVVVVGWNSPVLRQCLQSVAFQDHRNYDVILLDDNSDGQSQNISLAKQVLRGRFAGAFASTDRIGKVALYKKALPSIKPNRFVVNMDADDFFTRKDALSVISSFADQGAWFVFGKQVDLLGDGYTPADSANHIRRLFSGRSDAWFDHPHCTYSAILSAIPDERLKRDGRYARNCQDRFLFQQAMELCGAGRTVCTDEVLYLYNSPTPHNMRFRQSGEQLDMLRWFSSQPMLHALGDEFAEGFRS